MRHLITYLIILSMMLFDIGLALAGNRFASNYHCYDSGKVCVDSGSKTVEGFEVTRPCWQWSYTKTCSYPSRNDCGKYIECYFIVNKECLLRDSLGNCVNQKKEFSCRRWVPTKIESQHIRYGTEEKDGPENTVCYGVPCIDGNCVDKSYEIDEDMTKSVAQLYAFSQGKNNGYQFSIFEGQGKKCKEYVANSLRCCQVHPKGWGKNIGMGCSNDQRALAELRRKNLCVDVGITKEKNLGIKTAEIYHYCCFKNVLEKTIQVQGRQQLGKNFGSGGNPDCRGLTLEEIEQIDWSKIDFSEVEAELSQKLVKENTGDIKARINNSFGKVEGDFNNGNSSGVNNKLPVSREDEEY